MEDMIVVYCCSAVVLYCCRCGVQEERNEKCAGLDLKSEKTRGEAVVDVSKMHCSLASSHGGDALARVGLLAAHAYSVAASSVCART